MCEVFVLFRWLMGFPVLQSPYDKYELCCISSEANQRNLPPHRRSSNLQARTTMKLYSGARQHSAARTLDVSATPRMCLSLRAA